MLLRFIPKTKTTTTTKLLKKLSELMRILCVWYEVFVWLSIQYVTKNKEETTIHMRMNGKKSSMTLTSKVNGWLKK